MITEAAREAADARALVALVDAVFLLAGFVYGARRLRRLPKTYLSEIAFPLDFRAKLLASIALFVAHTLQWFVARTRPQREGGALFATLEALAWGMASTILWMEYRRSLPPSAFLRCFWLVKWIGAVFTFVVFQHFTPEVQRHGDDTLAVVLSGVSFAATCVLALLSLVPSTPISVDLVSFSQDVLSPTALLHSRNAQRHFSNYDSFKDVDWIRRSAQEQVSNASLNAFASTDEAMHAERSLEQSASTRSSISPAISVSIPSSTMSVWGKNQFVSYKIVVRTEEDTWTVRRHYSDFAALHEELPEEIRASCALPADLEASGNRRGFLSWKSRPRSMKARLENYLRLVLCHPALEPNSLQGLCDFLEMEYVDDMLTRSYHSAPRF